ncbi:tRNA preQ1(34) S-adenosylmethionine ribosyltransferase-isomerase QueA [Ferruginivarius sediminum]|uniref:S-adenosylmethionine:tRNA ribosyltransferase-isomerase n=1 Tax=Ferruginivarius sediminum TaxID=2661937 RepID=A0A369T735_9PROT|nr:tRNA preQ1(34) S-adenosylmethionine ribosyltransferase-isomerase QueA [Ferruginivarius sediminum]RDD60682.1 tRNA preQ1(34) S-adenosylmethionine ribosyltransferase-isomerase QueA [Ferruginivarius sediminum]
MRTDDFDFDLPREFVAQHPVRPRDAARLLDVGATLSDRHVHDLPDLLRPGDVAVFNDTRVIPARLFGHRDTVKVEATLHKPADGNGDGARWRAFARPGKRLRPGDTIAFDGGLNAAVEEKLEGGEVVLRFDRSGEELLDALETAGAMPLPPYIRRESGPDPRDREDYQTVFAQAPGAVAAPTAGLHFTERLLDALDRRGVKRVTVTLHVGAGTFLPVKADDPRDHPMHAEAGEIGDEAARTINEARAAGGRVVAIGTTALRLLETAAGEDGRLPAFAGESEIFILPGYRFKVVDLLFTNFHLPRSTLFMLVCAFAGTERMKQAYEHAKAAGYRFYSYGDACLLHPAETA